MKSELCQELLKRTNQTIDELREYLRPLLISFSNTTQPEKKLISIISPLRNQVYISLQTGNIKRATVYYSAIKLLRDKVCYEKDIYHERLICALEKID